MHKQSEWYLDEPHQAFWEMGYRDASVSCMGGPSFEVMEIAPLLPKNARVLDLGCGEGRNALYLASLGFDVTAVDRSTAGIAKLQRLCDTFGFKIKTQVADIREFPITQQYDLIMAHGVLYYLEKAEWRSLLTKIREQTKAGGFNIFTIFIYDAEYPCTSEIQAAHYLGSFDAYEIQQFYIDWEEIRFDKYIKWDAHPGVPLHYHPIEKLVTRKPSTMPLTFTTQIVSTDTKLSADDFHRIPIGMPSADLINFIGTPGHIQLFQASGNQYAPSGISSQGTVNGFKLELWHYQDYVIYLVNHYVEGRALHVTPPIQLLIKKDSLL